MQYRVQSWKDRVQRIDFVSTLNSNRGCSQKNFFASVSSALHALDLSKVYSLHLPSQVCMHFTPGVKLCAALEKGLPLPIKCAF